MPKDKNTTWTAEDILMEMAQMEMEDDGNANVIPNEQELASNVFCCAALADATQGTMYTDMNSSFPVQSLEVMRALFVVYDYDTDSIFAIPTKDLKDGTIIQAFEQVFNELEAKGYKLLNMRFN